MRERLSELVTLAEQLMLLARVQERSGAGLIKEVPLTALLDASTRRIAPLARARGVCVRADGVPPLIVYGDPALLARVTDNLLANAVQYNRAGGEVVLAASLEDASPGAWESGQAVLRVTDTGHGIPHEEWERVFERFHRLDRSRSRRTGGTGLGLSIAKAVLEATGGSIRVAASDARGTTFEVRLPGRAAPATEGDDPRPGSAPPLGASPVPGAIRSDRL